MRDNYAIAAERARELFAKRDQNVFIERHHLSADSDNLYLTFCGEPYRIRRSDGQIFREDGTKAGFSEVLSIYCLLDHEQTAPLANQWCAVNSLPHTLHSGSASGPATMNRSVKLSAQQFCQACQKNGKATQSKADFTYEYPIFGKVSVLLQYWEADEEFPAMIQCLWDMNVQNYVRYESLYYILGHLYHQLGL